MMLSCRELHCWSVRLDVAPETCETLFATLSPEEKARSWRLQGTMWCRFVVAHGGLRVLLADYLGRNAASLQFVHNQFGKPSLSEACGGNIRFNLSHSADLALVAVVANAEVGVDVEHVRDDPGFEEVARAFFERGEADRLSGVASELRPRAFLGGWTKKEAYAKALGTGLDMPTLNARPHGWSLFSLQPAPGFVGAVAVAGKGWRVVQRSASLDALATRRPAPAVMSCC